MANLNVPPAPAQGPAQQMPSFGQNSAPQQAPNPSNSAPDPSAPAGNGDPSQSQNQLNPQVLQALGAKMDQIGPQGQEQVKEALLKYKPFPQVVGLIYGQESLVFFQHIQQLLEQNSPQQDMAQAQTAAPENASLNSGGAQPAKATPNMPGVAAAPVVPQAQPAA